MNKFIAFFAKCCLGLAFFVFITACFPSRRHKAVPSERYETLNSCGIVKYDERNINETRESAIWTAKLSALRRAAEIFADAFYKTDGRAEAFEALINNEADLFIHKYKIIREWQERDKYNAELSVYLYLHKLASALKAAGLSAKVSGPKAAVYIEQNPKETNFSEIFKKKLFKDSVMSLISIPDSERGDGSYESFTAAAAKAGAEMLIKVKANAYIFAAAALADFYPAAAEGSAEVIKVPSGKRLCDISRQGSGNAANKVQALYNAMENLAEALTKDIAASVDPELKSDPVIKLVFSGLKNLVQVETLKNDLLKLGFKYLVLESYHSGKAVFSIITDSADTSEIASNILRAETLGLQLLEASGKEINFSTVY